ncbi:MAG: hypothetical protein ABI616_11735 [Pseudomonadota bacterium]
MKSRKTTLLNAAGSLLAASMPCCLPAAQDAGPDSFVALYSTTCMKYYNSAEKLRATMKEGGMTELTGAGSAFFLARQTGIAWRVPIEGESYVVALRQDGICTVFAEHAAIETVRKDFTKLVSKATPPVQAVSLPGGPSGTAVQTITYAWTRPADDEQLVFTLTTTTDPKAPTQAMATVALTAK